MKPLGGAVGVCLIVLGAVGIGMGLGLPALVVVGFGTLLVAVSML